MQHPSTHNSVDGALVTGGTIVQVGSVAQLTVQHGPADPARSPTAADPWELRATASGIWDHIPDSRDAEPWRRQTATVAARLAALRDEAGQRLAGDPWQDPGFAARFAERLEWVLGEPGRGPGLDLYPAEAALLVLTPFLYRVHTLRAAAERLEVEPWRLEAAAAADPRRASFEAFAGGHGLLVQRALLRPESGPEIGWWLFHRWLVRHGGYADAPAVADLLDAVGEPAAALGDVLDPLRVGRLLHGLRRGPDVCNAEFLETLPTDDRLPGPGHQHVRDQRLVLLTALAFAVSLEMTALPDIVADHLGIPHPVGLPRLRHTLEQSNWGGTRDLPVLRADCGHEAVVEGLRAATERSDELLHAVRRTVHSRVNHPMPVLPSRLSADGVRPAAGTFTGWAGFRLDERRVRGLLMGVQLYKDRDLAIRELYQNALDACRYRRARTEYLDRTHAAASFSYEGSISFVQDTDEDGREYVECRDDGIGMGEAELRGVFSQAGARFAEQQDFQEERAAWNRLEPPVPFFPNSRFGIGVLSYFMLADEIRVTTCRMGATGAPGPVLEASICGPGHLFRIVERAAGGARPGTTVRLYLRPPAGGGADLAPSWSSPDVLGRLLAIAEFPTDATHGAETREWVPGELRAREQPDGELFGLDAHGTLRACPDMPEGAQVIWCENGGGLLVDGLVVHPLVRGDVLSAQGAGLAGAVVNLSGPFAPQRLSADRSEILDDLRGTVRELLAGAVGWLVAQTGTPPTFEWLCDIAEGSMPLADLITAECIAAAHPLVHEKAHFNTGQTGCLPADVQLAAPKVHGPYRSGKRNPLMATGYFPVPDHVHLWRLLAHRPHSSVIELSQICPELGEVGPVLAALPSDHRLLDLRLDNDSFRKHDAVGRLTDAAVALSRTPRDVARRAALLGLHKFPPDAFPDALVPPGGAADAALAARTEIAVRTRELTVPALVRLAVKAGSTVAGTAAWWRDNGTEVPDTVHASALALAQDEQLLAHVAEVQPAWFVPGTSVHPGALAATALALDVPLDELCVRLARCGLAADGTGLSDVLDEVTVPLLSEHLLDGGPLLSRTLPVPPSRVLLAAETWGVTPAAAMDRYTAMGFIAPEPFPAELRPEDETLLTDQGDLYGYGELILRPGDPVPYTHLLIAAESLETTPWEVADRLRDFGIDVPLHEPSELHHPLDADLFEAEGPLSWHLVTTDDPLPFAHVIFAARHLLVSPELITDRLHDWGIPLSCDALPEGLSYANAQALLSTQEEMLLTHDDHVDLADLLRRARQMYEPLVRVRSWLVQLGIPTVDPARAVEAALPLVPRPPGGPSAPGGRTP